MERIYRKNVTPIVPAIIFLAGLLFLSGCSQPSASSQEQVRKFDRVGAIRHLQDTQNTNVQVNSKYDCVYRVTPGDVLELSMPETMQETSWDSMRRTREEKDYYCRVSEDGTITLPVVGALQVAGMTTSQVEAVIVESHYPKYVTRPPAVVCSVDEHRDQRTFAVMGLVNKPDSFEYPPNARFTLTDAIAMAGGTNIIANPRYATIYRQNDKGEVFSATVKIDSPNLAKASKILIEPGDIVSVDRSIGTEMNMVLDRILNFGVGASITP
ncbi:MAG: polysaccharide biosynthesis/export family protein [Phycisphaerae bacterium]|jgi:polysaccharide export outer membrane protein